MPYTMGIGSILFVNPIAVVIILISSGRSRAQDTIFVKTRKCTDSCCVRNIITLLSMFYFFLYTFLFTSFVVIGFSVCYFILFVKTNCKSYFLSLIRVKMFLWELITPNIPSVLNHIPLSVKLSNTCPFDILFGLFTTSWIGSSSGFYLFYFSFEVILFPIGLLSLQAKDKC